jgi:glycosyltransferase involved in cell wall biosynthesis
LTIGITAYREGRWLQECWDSVAAQTDPRWEAVLVLDGGASRATRRIFERLLHPRLRKLRLLENGGPYRARARAIQEARTGWYAHLDADDRLPAEAVARILAALERQPEAQFVFGDTLYFSARSGRMSDFLTPILSFSRTRGEVSEGREGVAVKWPNLPDTAFRSGRFELKPIQTFNIDGLVYGPAITGVTPIAIALYRFVGGYAPSLVQGGADWDFWIGVAEAGAAGVRADGVLYERRSRPRSVGAGWIVRRPEVARIIIERHPQYFSDPDRRRRCIGYSCELAARALRAKGRRQEAARQASQAVELGFDSQAMQAIIEEGNMSPWRYLLRRLGRLLPG